MFRRVPSAPCLRTHRSSSCSLAELKQRKSLVDPRPFLFGPTLTVVIFLELPMTQQPPFIFTCFLQPSPTQLFNRAPQDLSLLPARSPEVPWFPSCVSAPFLACFPQICCSQGWQIAFPKDGHALVFFPFHILFLRRDGHSPTESRGPGFLPLNLGRGW